MRHFTFVALAVAWFAGAAWGQAIPERIGFQGRLTDASGNPVNGTVNLAFTLYDAASGGATVWTETQSNVPVSGGLYGVSLGDGTGLDSTLFDKPYWLGVKVGEDAEMAPLYRLAASPYAMRAKMANGLEGREARFLELLLNGSNYIGFRAPDAIGANLLWTLPATDGTSGQVLTTNGSGLLSWSTAGGSGTVTSVGSGTGLTGGPITTSGSLSFDTAFGDGRYVTLSSDQTITGAKTFSNAANSFAGSSAGLTGVELGLLGRPPCR